MRYDSLPIELKQLNQWVCCKKDNKIPMRAFEPKPASSSDPSTWSSYELAQHAVDMGYYDYLGFVFDNNGIVGIDIDAGFSDDNNMFLTPDTYDILSSCKSYTELSKSGRGFHIFVKGTLPFSGKNNQRGLEIYQDSRFFVMTGRQRYYPQIIENQYAIDQILKTYFPEETRTASENKPAKPRYYSPIIKSSVVDGKLKMNVEYPPIAKGNRNNSMLSLAGQLLTRGMSKMEIYRELLKINEQIVTPPLTDREIQAIVKSVMKYSKDQI